MSDTQPHYTRLEFIRKSLTVTAGVCALGAIPACSLLDEPEMLVCDMADLQGKDYFITKFNRKKIFVTYLDEELVIFSLVCTHKKCTVEFKEALKEFHCPCHDGIYSQQGQVIDGPPPEPLRRLKHEIRQDQLWVLKEFI